MVSLFAVGIPPVSVVTGLEGVWQGASDIGWPRSF
jgi:hypothetical protein